VTPRVDLPLVALAALLAPVATGVLFWLWHRRRLAHLRALGVDAAVARLAPADVRRPPVARGVRVALALALATFAFAGPRWGEGTIVVRERGLDVALAMDASLSMLAEDERPNRLERMKQEVRRYRAASPGDRNALIAFAGRSYILSPLTSDEGAIGLFLDNLDPSVVGLAGTALAPTIRQATDLLGAARGAASRALVILSDGEAFDDRSAAIAAAREARRAGIAVITVGFGTEEGTTIPIREGGTVRTKQDENGETVITRYDPSLLRDVAEAGGGEFIAAGEGDKGSRIHQALSRLDADQRAVEEGLSRPLRVSWFLLPVVILLLLDAWRADGGSLQRLRRALHLAGLLLVLPATPRPAAAQDPMRLFNEGRYAEAANRWRRAVAQGDRRASLLYNLGTALLAADSLETAEQALERVAFTPDPELRQRALYNLGLVRLRRGLRADGDDRTRALASAIAVYRALLLERPDDVDAKWNFELALREQQSGGGGSRSEPQQEPLPSPRAPPEEGRPMSPQQAEQLLAAAARDERLSQARRQSGSRAERPPGGRDW